MKYSGHRKLLCELSKLSKLNASILVYKFRPERTGFNMYAELYATAINFACIKTLIYIMYNLGVFLFFVITRSSF